MHRRILKEVLHLGTTYPVATPVAQEVVAELPGGVQVRFHLSKNYPFTAPEVRCYGRLYPAIFADPACHGLCLCCTSILCGARWEPMMTMMDVMQEIEANIAERDRRRRVAVERRLARQVVRTHLFEECPVEPYL